MPPQLALFICFVFILYLFRKDTQRNTTSSKAVWVPLIWMFLAGSRYVSQWLNLGVPVMSADSYSEGSPIDRIIFFSLIAIGAVILYRRNLAWGELLYQNKWIVLYYLYCLLSVAWTDAPFVLLKRWIKDLANPIMALVLL